MTLRRGDDSTSSIVFKIVFIGIEESRMCYGTRSQGRVTIREFITQSALETGVGFARGTGITAGEHQIASPRAQWKIPNVSP